MSAARPFITASVAFAPSISSIAQPTFIPIDHRSEPSSSSIVLLPQQGQLADEYGDVRDNVLYSSYSSNPMLYVLDNNSVSLALSALDTIEDTLFQPLRTLLLPLMLPVLCTSVQGQIPVQDTSFTIVVHGRAPLLEKDIFPFTTTDRLCPKRLMPETRQTPLDSADRNRLLQDHASLDTRSTFHLFARLPDGQGPCITILSSRSDNHLLLWILYDEQGKVIGLDTLAWNYREGGTACAYYDKDGVFSLDVIDNESLRDETDTMAYMCDTLQYEVRTVPVSYLGKEHGETRYGYGLRSIPRDLTARWVECHADNERPPYSWRSVKALIPSDRRVLQTASGDLDNDGKPDHVLVLTNENDDGHRDLLIAFTERDACDFVQKALLRSFLPSSDSGGFHDPIGEEGISGISISGDSLVVHIFGGSAWKWEERSIYKYSPSHDAFFLVREESRSYHASGASLYEEDWRYLEDAEQAGTLTPEEEERLAEARNAEETSRWQGSTFTLGEKPMTSKY